LTLITASIYNTDLVDNIAFLADSHDHSGDTGDGASTLPSFTYTNPTATYQTLTDAANISWDMDSGTIAEVTLADNRTLDNPTNMKAGSAALKVIQDGTGGRTLAYGAAFQFPGGPPTLTTAAGSVDWLTFLLDGTTIYGAIASDFTT